MKPFSPLTLTALGRATTTPAMVLSSLDLLSFQVRCTVSFGRSNVANWISWYLGLSMTMTFWPRHSAEPATGSSKWRVADWGPVGEHQGDVATVVLAGDGERSSELQGVRCGCHWVLSSFLSPLRGAHKGRPYIGPPMQSNVLSVNDTAHGV